MSTNPPTPGHVVIEPSGALDIYAAAGLRSTWLESLESSDEITLDLSAVEACDTAGMQLILSAIRTARDARKELHLARLPTAVCRAAEALGVDISEIQITPPCNPSI